MKKPILFAVLFIMVLASVAAILQSGWTGTTVPSIARTALGAAGLTNNNIFTGSNYITGYIASSFGSGTNTDLTGSTNWGTVGRSNFTRMSGSGWETTNTSAENQGVRIYRGQMIIDGGGTNAAQLSVGETNLVVSTTGFIGLGTAGPLSILHVKEPVSHAMGEGVQIYSESRRGGYGAGIAFVSEGNYDLFDLKTQAKIVAEGTGAWNADASVDSKLSFWTVNDNSLTEKMVIDNAGNAGVGVPIPAAKLDVAGDIRASTTVTATNGLASYRSNLLAAATITVGASPFSWTNTSDVNVTVYIDGISVTGTVGINGGTVFNSIGQNTIILQPGGRTTITYTLGTPTATWKPF